MVVVIDAANAPCFLCPPHFWSLFGSNGTGQVRWMRREGLSGFILVVAPSVFSSFQNNRLDEGGNAGRKIGLLVRVEGEDEEDNATRCDGGPCER